MAWTGVFGISAFTVLVITLSVTFGEPIPEAHASDPFIAEIIYFGGNFAPRGWGDCDGALLPISNNQALFSLLGTTYGGDGRTTFALPDHRGRVALDDGQGPGLSDRKLGSRGGAETVTLNVQQMPFHTHSIGELKLQGTPVAGDTVAVTGNALALTFARTYSTTAPTAAMHTDSISGNIGNNGGGQAHDNMPPFVTLKCIIALVGTFPSR